MANETIRARIEVLLKGMDQVESLKNAVRQLQTTASPAAADLQKLKNAALQLGGAADRSENDLRRSINALKDVRAQLSITDAEYRKLTGTINKYQAQLDKATGAQQRGGKALQFAQTAGAVAASGVFGGPEGLIGAGIGAFFGPQGALAGGAIGAQVSIVRQQIAAMADQAAQFQRLQIALKGVTQSSREYEAAMGVINNATRSFNVTKQEAIQGFTGLAAAVIGAGGKVRDAELVFNGVSSAIRATGGSAEDVQGALVAMAQVFSKGKATAEEIQGQLGERLPGAVTLFAEATGRTGAELAKAFEQGTVGLNDVMKFAIALGDKYAETNEKIASSSEASGERLKVAFATLREEFGRTFQPLGSAIQDMTASLAEAASQMLLTARNSEELNAALGEATKNSTSAAKALEEFKKTGTTGVDGGIGDAILQWFSGTTELETQLRNTDTQLQASITRFYEAEGAVAAHRKALLASGQSLEEQGKAISAAQGALIIFEGRLRTLALQNKNNTKEAEFYRAKVAELKGVLDSVKGTYKAKIEIQQIFSGNAPGAGPNAGKSIPDGYRKIAGKLAYQVPGVGWVDARTGQPIFKSGSGGDRGQSTFQNPDSKDGSGESEAKKAAAAAKRDADERQRTEESLAKARIALDDAVHRNAMELIRKRYEYEQELINKQRDNWVKSQTGAARTTAGIVAQFLGELDQMQGRMVQAQQQLADSTQKLKSTQAMAVTTVGGGVMSGPGFSAAQLQAAAQEASRFTGIANMCAESVKAFYKSLGISLPGVTAWADTVRKAGQVMTDWSKLQPGDIVATGRPGDTPHVGVYTGGDSVFHQSRSRGLAVGNYPDLGYFKSGGYFVRPSAGGGVGAAGRRDIAAEGSANIAEQDLATANQLLNLYNEQLSKLTPEAVKGFVLNLTDDLRQQNAALKDSAAITALRNRLQLEGVRPEIIDSEVKKAEAVQQNSQSLATLQTLLDAAKAKLQELEAANKGNTQEAINAKTQVDAYSQGIAALNPQLEEFKNRTDAATAAQIAFSDAMRFRQDMNIGAGIREGAQQYVDSIGTMREATAQLAQTGIKGVEDALVSLVTTGTANFREFAASILKDTARMIIQQLVLRTIMQVIGAIGGGVGGGGFSGFSGAGPVSGASVFSSGQAGFNPGAFSMPSLLSAQGNVFDTKGVVPYAMGGIVTRPTLFKFANGGYMNTGLMGEAGPEAIIPLRRGRDGKLGVAGGGGATNVTVNVDAKGTSVQGNSGQGEQLGRAISQAVQAELVRQKRPGGLLAA
jgi:lambda family phage tail tape measure protein